tara:strand:+ start:241 stop:627 length:387 start_codon:yes stop_codon:yes gene_type:complete
MKLIKLLFVSLTLILLASVSYGEEKTVIVQSAQGQTLKCKLRFGLLQTDCEVINKKTIEQVAKEKTDCENIKGDSLVGMLKKIKCLGKGSSSSDSSSESAAKSKCSGIKANTGENLIKKIKCLQGKSE